MSDFETLSRLAYEQLEIDANRIVQLIEVQMANLTMPQCPVYEEVLDTQMFGLSKEINFAVRLGLIDKDRGKEILEHLEKKFLKFMMLTINIKKKIESRELSLDFLNWRSFMAQKES